MKASPAAGASTKPGTGVGQPGVGRPREKRERSGVTGKPLSAVRLVLHAVYQGVEAKPRDRLGLSQFGGPGYDVDAGGRHHSIPSRWVESVEGKVTLNKTAAEAKQQWQDEERNSAMFNYGDNAGADRTAGAQASSRSTSGAKTY